MANKSGAQLGNTNAVKNRPISEAIMVALKEECMLNGKKTIKLRKLASMLVDRACDGDTQATKEVLNRIEGQPTQHITGDGEGLVINITRFTDAVDGKTDVPVTSEADTAAPTTKH